MFLLPLSLSSVCARSVLFFALSMQRLCPVMYALMQAEPAASKEHLGSYKLRKENRVHRASQIPDPSQGRGGQGAGSCPWRHRAAARPWRPWGATGRGDVDLPSGREGSLGAVRIIASSSSFVENSMPSPGLSGLELSWHAESLLSLVLQGTGPRPWLQDSTLAVMLAVCMWLL